jgi:hypothetical protein
MMPSHSRNGYGLPAHEVAYATLCMEVFSNFVACRAAPMAAGWNDSFRAAIASAEDARLFAVH